MGEYSVRPRSAVLGVAMALVSALGLAPAGAAASPEPLPWIADQVLVGLAAGADEGVARAAVAAAGGRVIPVAPVDDFVRVCGGSAGLRDVLVAQLPGEAEAASFTRQVRTLPGVAFAQRNHRIVTADGTGAGTIAPAPSARTNAATGTPDDEFFPIQWALRNTGQAFGEPPRPGLPGEDIRVEGVWREGTGEGQVIAVLDEGLRVDHPDLAANMWTNAGEVAGNGVDDDGNGWIDDIHGWSVWNGTGQVRPLNHGTMVAGVAAAVTGNGIGVAGVAPGARIMAVDFIGPNFTDANSTSEINALGAFAYAIANGATVINNSWGFPAPAGMGSPVMHAAVRCAGEADIFIAWSGGNTTAVPQVWPAYYPAEHVVITGWHDHEGCLAFGSQPIGALVDVLAPGTSIWTTTGVQGGVGDYDWFGASSSAAPHTAGVAALLRGIEPGLRAADVAWAIRSGARRPFPEPWSRSLGYLSAEHALAAARGERELLAGDTGTDPARSRAGCVARPHVDSVNYWVPQLADIAPRMVDAVRPGTWPPGLPWPGTLWPGLPRP